MQVSTNIKTARELLRFLAVFYCDCKHITPHRYGKRCGFVRVRYGGGDGNRTRVQKPLDMTFSVGSLSFFISRAGTSANRLSFAVALFCLTGSRAKDRCKFTAVNDAQARGAVFPGGTGGYL